MKKIVYILIATLLVTNFSSFTPSAEISDEQFTHVVFAEEFTATWCVYCPSAAENLMKVYDDIPNEPYYHDKFFFVALITDVNDKADQRMDDYPDVTGYPTVIFDGNDEKVSGGQSDTSNYEQAVDNCGQRDDTDISLAIEMNHLGADQLEVSVKMTWNEDGTLGNPTFDGFIRAYIISVCIFATIDIIYSSDKWPIDLGGSYTFELVEKGSNYLIKEFPDKKEYEDAKEKVQEL